jgi:hypothetical protein
MDILDLFASRLELVKEHSTWIEYLCPKCKSTGLKINKNTSKYKNFKCSCNIQSISYEIFKNSDILYEKKERIREPPVIIQGIPNILNVKLSPIYLPPSLHNLDGIYSDLSAKITYPYSDKQRTLRINKVKKTGKKIVFPQVLTLNGWVNGIGDNIFPLYTSQRTLIGELIIVVEGEKCVDYLNTQGIEAISYHTTYSESLEKIKNVLEVSKSFIPNIKQFLYIPDLDVPGLRKAIIFQQASWSLGIPSKIFDIRTKLKLGLHFKGGYDIADYISENPETNLKEIFENEFSAK